MSKFSEKISDKWQRANSKTRRRIAATSYSFVVLLAAGGLVLTYKSPDMTFETDLITTDATNSSAIIDKTREADLASIVAASAELSIKNNVSERAISIYTKSEAAQTDEAVITKPTLVSSDSNISLTTYTTIEGDNADAVAAKFGVTAQTIKWANGLVNNDIAVGTNLTIPVVDGVVYVVKDGDTIEKLVEKYGGSSAVILGQNNIDALSTGAKIIIPGGVLPTNERPGYVAYTPIRNISSGRASYSYSLSIGTSYAGNNYSYGYCTWYAYNRRVELGLAAYRSLGNANTWDDRSRAAGITVSRIPIPGSIFQTDAGYYGHVGIVESVNPDGTINISDMNGIAGWGRRGVSNGVSPSGYWFIY